VFVQRRPDRVPVSAHDLIRQISALPRLDVLAAAGEGQAGQGRHNDEEAFGFHEGYFLSRDSISCSYFFLDCSPWKPVCTNRTLPAWSMTNELGIVATSA
jgi:hypothetical protein